MSNTFKVKDGYVWSVNNLLWVSMMDLYVRATIVIVLFGVVKTQTGKYLSNIKILDCFVYQYY